MDGKTRRMLHMVRRARDFARAHPVDSAGYVAALKRLEEGLARADEVADRQRDGQLEVRGSTVRKGELTQQMRNGHLSHLVHVAKVAAQEVPELAEKFAFKPNTRTHQAFRTAARGMATVAQGNKEVLVKYGLVESVLDSLIQVLDQFDAAMERGAQGRRAHVGASAELRNVAEELVQIVQSMDGVNRLRFANDADLLAEWESASNILATPRSAPAKPGSQEPPPGGEVRAA
jgi:hypothetical protein